MIYYDEYCNNINKLEDKLRGGLIIASELVEFEEMWESWSNDYTRIGYAKDVYNAINNAIEVVRKTK